MKTSIIITGVLAATLLLAQASYADAPSRLIDSKKQAARDQEKFGILEAELKEQREKYVGYAKIRAIALKDNSKKEVEEADAHLAEVANNIHQLEQEISLALQGNTPITQPAQPEPASISVTSYTGYKGDKPIEPQAASIPASIQPPPTARKWWDFYQQGH